MVWLGLAACSRRTSEKNLSVGSGSLPEGFPKILPVEEHQSIPTCLGGLIWRTIGTSWSRAKRKNLRRRWPWCISKATCCSHSAVLAENRNSCAFSEVLLSLELRQSVTCGGCFSENSKSYVILEVFLVGFELLRSSCLRRRCVMRILFFHVFFQ